jgi:nucleotide-binding universal stress UspA family protein
MRRGRVVVGVDGSLAGLQALRWAVDEARRREADVYAVRAWQFHMAWQGAEVGQWRNEIQQEAVAEVRTAFQDALGAVPADVTVQAVAAEGPVAEALIEYAYLEDDLIVVGASSRRWGSRRGVGGTCLRSALCPVVVVPPPVLARSSSLRALSRQLSRETEEYVSARERPGSAPDPSPGSGHHTLPPSPENGAR